MRPFYCRTLNLVGPFEPHHLTYTMHISEPDPRVSPIVCMGDYMRPLMTETHIHTDRHRERECVCMCVCVCMCSLKKRRDQWPRRVACQVLFTQHLCHCSMFSVSCYILCNQTTGLMTEAAVSPAPIAWFQGVSAPPSYTQLDPCPCLVDPPCPLLVDGALYIVPSASTFTQPPAAAEPQDGRPV